MLPAVLLQVQSPHFCLPLVISVHLPVGGQVSQAALEEDSLSWDWGYFEKVAQKVNVSEYVNVLHCIFILSVLYPLLCYLLPSGFAVSSTCLCFWLILHLL